jgi:hypothetical protein
MTTLTELTIQCRNLIGDYSSTYFTDTILYDHINRGIEDLSKYFPLVKEYALTTTLNVRKYDFEADFLEAISVEYPTGEEPPQYLLRRSYTHPSFWSEDGFYDIVRSHDATSTNPTQIYISQKPATGQTITVKYHCIHTTLVDSGDVCTIPAHLIHLIGLFVRWKVWQEIATAEGLDPEQTKLLAATQEVNATRAERQYRAALSECKKALVESAQVHWKMDKHDCIY